MNDEPLHAHSLAEIYLYLMVTPCESCGGPIRRASDRLVDGAESSQLSIVSRCHKCGHEHTFTFRITDDAPPVNRDELFPIVSATDEPSRMIDVGQWITLFRVILEAAGNENDKIEARRLGFEAAQCLEEALKFYDDENELPPEHAAFSDHSQARLREHPQLFARQRLLDLRAKLPSNVKMMRRLESDARESPAVPRPWWRFWA